MRALSLLSLLFLLGLAGCGGKDAVGPQLPDGVLNGNWVTANFGTGAGKSLVLTSSQGQVAGTGQDYDNQHQVIGSYTINGVRSNNQVSLAMSYNDGSSASFNGEMPDSDTVKGTWTGTNGGDITLVRAN